jgi:hypothetical protein
MDIRDAMRSIGRMPAAFALLPDSFVCRRWRLGLPIGRLIKL